MTATSAPPPRTGLPPGASRTGLPEGLTHTATATMGATTTRTRLAAGRRSWAVRAVVAVTGAALWARGAARVAASAASRTVNPGGWLVLVFATAGLAAGWAFGWVEALVAGVASLALVVMGVPFLFGARGYEIAVDVPRERVVAGSALEGEIVVRNAGARVALPGRLDLPVGAGLVELGVPLLRAGQESRQQVSVPAMRRGIITVGPPTAVRSDPVGLLRREREWDQRLEIFVHPRTAAIPSTSAGLVRDLEGSPSRRLVDADMSFHAIREYMPGDARRQIHWKSTAKTGRLMVRQFEQTLRATLAVVLAVERAGYASEDEFELGVSVAASLAVQAVRDGRDIDVVTGVDIPRVVRGRMRSIDVLHAATPQGMLDGFCRIDALESTLPLTEVCRLAEEASEILSLTFLVCGSQTDPVELRKAALAFPADTAVVAVVCDLDAHPHTRPLGGLTVLTVGMLDDLRALLLRGAQAGEPA